MSKTVFNDTPPTGTVVSAAFLNGLNNHRHTGADEDGAGALDYAVSTGSSNAYAIALSPALTAHVAGMPIRFKANHTNTGAATLAVNAMSAVAIKRPDGTALQANDILSGAMITTIYDGTNYQLINNSQYVNLSQFARNIAVNGYQKLPGGLIIQWGKYDAAISGEATITITLPITFPNACLNAMGNTINTDSQTGKNLHTQVVSIGLSSIVIFVQRHYTDTVSCDGIYWFAIGY